jgi:hypothetical protein
LSVHGKWSGVASVPVGAGFVEEVRHLVTKCINKSSRCPLWPRYDKPGTKSFPLRLVHDARAAMRRHHPDERR